jgi:HSP20 family protein
MAVFRWGQAWDAFRDLEREVDRILQGVNQTFQGLRIGRKYPPINLYELPHEYLLTAEVPATRPEDLDLTIAAGVLSLKGRRGNVEDVPEEKYRRRERPHGVWQRSVTIPDRVREEGLSAEFRDGILTVHLPKADDVRPRQIPVLDGGE